MNTWPRAITKRNAEPPKYFWPNAARPGQTRPNAANRAGATCSNGGMNTPTNPAPNPPLSAADIEARIRAEGERLLTEQNLEEELGQQRVAPLEAGDDDALNRIEQRINECRDRQLRIQERAGLLKRRLEEARQRERDAELDHVVAVADRAREIGERLITEEYAEHATALARMLGKLTSINALIDAANARMEGTNRKGVARPNVMRCRRGREWIEKETVRVGIYDRDHPYFGKAELSRNNPDVAYLRGSDETVPARMTIEREVRKHETTNWERDLIDVVLLPGVGPAPEGSGLAPLWDQATLRRAWSGAGRLREEIEAAMEQEAADSVRDLKRAEGQRK